MADVEKLLRALHQHRVEYVLVGGVAGAAQGATRLTFDVDLCYARTRENLERLASALAPFRPYLRGTEPGLPFSLDAATLRAGLNFTLTTDIGDIDLFGELQGLGSYEAVRRHSQALDLFGLPCQLLTLEGLILNKKAVGRPKDLDALRELEALRELRQGGASDLP
ncbi:MAG: hypothetical protein HY724_05455 [Candidatus Rokubacteria bacterium]|nr:hypothetical protein [Candidatus Rokubacteria bacterium]